MKGRFLIGAHEPLVEGNIYADKSSLVLDWLLQIGINKEQFSIREVAKNRNISVGLVQKIFRVLVLQGFLVTKGVRTSKKFMVKNPSTLLDSWLNHYNIVKKCKMWTYRTGFQERDEALHEIKKSHLNQKVALALHSAVDVYGFKNTNLKTIELYLLDTNIKSHIEDVLELDPQERGYEILLIEPYYKSMLKYGIDLQKQDSKKYKKKSNIRRDSLHHSPLLLTFLDLFHFPLRGQEQAEFMGKHIPELNRILKD